MQDFFGQIPRNIPLLKKTKFFGSADPPLNLKVLAGFHPEHTHRSSTVILQKNRNNATIAKSMIGGKDRWGRSPRKITLYCR